MEAGFIVANVSALDKKQGSFKAVQHQRPLNKTSSSQPTNQMAALKNAS
jgi:hypothetical protein